MATGLTEIEPVEREPPAQPRRELPPFLLLFSGLYLAYGTESAYMPAFLLSHGLTPQTLGFILAAGTIIRIGAGPVAGRLGDHIGTTFVLAICFALAGSIGCLYLVAFDTLPLLAVSTAHSAATAPLAPLADALAVAAAQAGKSFKYGWVRGAGSAAFVVGTLLSGIFVDSFGLSFIIVASGALFLITAFAVWFAVAKESRMRRRGSTLAAALALWQLVIYRRVLLVAALVIGSHAMNDAFAVVAWRQAGVGNGTISLLWSLAVVSEVVVFTLVGPWLLAQLGPAGAAALAASAGIVRWAVLGTTAAVPVLAFAQASHGLTFALMHITAMDIIGRHVPAREAATAQAVYGTVALGLASAILTMAAGYLYDWFDVRALWGMAGICAVALVLTPGLREAMPLAVR